ncbi:MAG: endonuclease [Bacteroidota bacterium]|nr:endonuclease [Bacteroidota bacterium]
MEGPSLLLAKEQLQPFKGKKIIAVSGNTTIEKERFQGEEVKEIFNWGKHLVFQFPGFALKVHFLMFGTFEADVEGVTVTGDYKRPREPRLAFMFANGELRMFSCSVKIIEDRNFKKSYDFSVDVLHRQWDPEKAMKAMKQNLDEQIADVLLDQNIFSGVGNIIKNEILALAGVRPITKVRDLKLAKRRELIDLARSFSRQFYKWRKVFMLRKNLRIHRKHKCPVCRDKLERAKTGKRVRWSYWCERCQR